MSREPLNVTPEVLNREANRLLDHMDESVREHRGHHDDMADAAPGWIGESAQALAGLRVHWEDQRAELHRELGNQSTLMQEAAVAFVAMDHL